LGSLGFYLKSNPQKMSPFLILIGLLLFSLAIRLILIFNGGEPLHDDGGEYFSTSKSLHKHIALLNWNGFFNTHVFAHWGGALLGIIPFFITTPWLSPAQTFTLFFAAPAIINIYLLYRITIYFGGSQKTALISAGLYTLSFSGFYQAQHGHYFDFSLTFFLLGIIFTLKSKDKKLGLFFSGVFYFLCFFSYYGYWTISFIGMLFLASHKAINIKHFLIRGLTGATGFFIPLSGFFLASSHHEANYFQHLLIFSQTITHGNFEQGHAIPFLFLWHAEGPLSLVWLSCLLFSIFYTKNYAVKCSLFAILLVYGLWVLGSNLLESFVVYGRLVKSVVPLLCLNAAFVMSSLNAPALITIFILLMPNPLINSWKNWPATYIQDIKKYERDLRELYEDNRVVKLSTRCIPDLPSCQKILFDPLEKNCIVKKSYVSKLNLAFNQYDGLTLESRRVLRDHIFIIDASICPNQDSS
jgi:hypothetical protein